VLIGCRGYTRKFPAELFRSANNLFQLTDSLSLLVNKQLRIANDVDEQDVPNLELDVRLRMSGGHIPLRRSNYMPHTPIYQQNFPDSRLRRRGQRDRGTHEHKGDFKKP
jgi:hypothetical protein